MERSDSSVEVVDSHQDDKSSYQTSSEISDLPDQKESSPTNESDSEMSQNDEAAQVFSKTQTKTAATEAEKKANKVTDLFKRMRTLE